MSGLFLPGFTDATANEIMANISPNTWGYDRHGKLLAPKRVEIQPTAKCNRKCLFCSHKQRNRSGAELSQAKIEALLDEIKHMGCRKISISGGGEPLEWTAGNLEEVLKKAGKFAAITMTTNGDQLWDEITGRLKPLGDLLLEYCEAIILNVPDVNEAGFQKQIPDNASWPRTEKIIQSLINKKALSRAIQCKLIAVVVINALNINNIIDIDRTLKSWRLDQIYYKLYKNYENDAAHPLDLNIKIEDLSAKLHIGECSADLIRFIESLQVIQAKPVPCWAVRLGFSAIVNPQGDIYLCTPSVGKHEYSIGNIYRNTFASCWDSPARLYILKKLNELSINGKCPMECRFHSHNQQIHNYLFNTGNSGAVTVPAIYTINAGIENQI